LLGGVGEDPACVFEPCHVEPRLGARANRQCQGIAKKDSSFHSAATTLIGSDVKPTDATDDSASVCPANRGP
jgi:hypothetical protein